MAGKEAIAFVLDASPSMATPYPSIRSGGGGGGGGGGGDSGDGDGRSHPPSEIRPATTGTAAAAGDEPSQPSQSQSSLTSSQGLRLERGLLDGIEEEIRQHQAEAVAATRLSAAREACASMISNLILQSKANECAVIVCKSSVTRHHLCSEEQVEDGTAPFPNILELGEMCKPTVELLRRVRDVEPSSLVKAEGSDDGVATRGDLCDGIVVAADALHRRTAGRKYKRRLVVFTDAQHTVRVDDEQLLMVVEGLKKLECTLTVIGLDFTDSAEFDKPATEEDVDMDEGDDDGDGQGEDDGNGDGADGDGDGNGDADGSDSDSDATGHVDDYEQRQSPDEDEPRRHALVKSENEKLLISLARLTGGSVIAASTLRQVLDSTAGRRIPKSARRNVELNIAPGLSVSAKYSLLLSRQNIRSLKREAVLLDSDGKVQKNGLGEDMTSDIVAYTTHWDKDRPDTEVTLDKRTQAFKYGADLIPLGAFDLEGLKMRSPVSITILGYAKSKSIPRSHIIGDPYAVTGGDSRRACTAISALSQSLHSMDLAALCKFVKTKDADPLLGALVPLVEDQHSKEGGVPPPPPRRLCCLQLPFANDVQMISMFPLDDDASGEGKKAEAADVCDALIDSLMLPGDALVSERIPNPAVRSFNQTLMDRAVDPTAGVAVTRVKGGEKRGAVDGGGGSSAEEDPMSTPRHVLDRARGAIQAFLSAFPLEKPDESDKKGSRTAGKKKFWSYAY